MSKEHLLLNSEQMRPIMNRSHTLQASCYRNQLTVRCLLVQLLTNTTVMSSSQQDIPTPDIMSTK